MMVKIMVVDDTAFMRIMLKDVLVLGGHEIIAEASNGEEAVHLFKLLKPDLVTMDITMPEMDGIKALTEIMKFDPQAKVIMCSAMGKQDMVLEAIHAGAKDFILKPFQMERVLLAVDNVLGE
jgi:two-component system, chemotaxis family, chemotaxis protein CheY